MTIKKNIFVVEQALLQSSAFQIRFRPRTDDLNSSVLGGFGEEKIEVKDVDMKLTKKKLVSDHALWNLQLM